MSSSYATTLAQFSPHFPLMRSATYADSAPRTTYYFPSRPRSPYTSTPAYLERHAYLRTYYNFASDPVINVLYNPRSHGHYSERDSDSLQYVDSSLNSYTAGLDLMPAYGTTHYGRSSRPDAPQNPGAKPFATNDRNPVQTFREFMKHGQTARYWQRPSYWQNKRDDQWKHSLDLAQKGFSYYSHYSKD